MRLLTPADLPAAVQDQIQRRLLTTKQILMQQGEPADHLFWVVAGRLRLVSFVNHQMITHYFVDAGDFFAETALHFDTYGCTVVAEMPSEVMVIPKEAFATALKQSPTLSEWYLASLTHRFASVKQLLELRSISSARDRLLHYLLTRRVSGNNTVILEKPLQTIASELALTPEGLSRLLSRLQNDGIFSRKKRSITFSEEWLADALE